MSTMKIRQTDSGQTLTTGEIEMARAWHCDGPGCDTWTRGLGLEEWPIITIGFAFCSWDCVLRYSATKTPMEVISND